MLLDNTATVAATNNQTSRIEQSAHLLRCLAFLSAQFQCTFVAEHFPGRHNARVDVLSRNNPQLFLSLSPYAHQDPTLISVALLQLLIIEHPDWTSQRWTELWRDILKLE